MPALKAIQETFEKEYAKKEGYSDLYRQRLIGFRREPLAIVRIEKPTNIARAHKLGYKAKKGFVMARVRIRKGSGLHRRPHSGRRPKRMGVRKLTRKKNIQTMAEVRANEKFPNCEVLNSYWIGEDGKYKYFEIILVDISAPEIQADREINWICSNKHKQRAVRGLTSAGKKARGLLHKGEGTEKNRPGVRARGKKAK